ncbi:MAG TPA: response regulator [Devosia sp.]
MDKLKVLYVDDDPDIREIAIMSLGLDPDMDVRGEGSGAEALLAARSWQPNAILLDVMMPSMDGPTTLRHLRECAETAAIPVIFITARAQTREVDEYLAMGALAVIVKPFDPMTLAKSVRSHVTS